MGWPWFEVLITDLMLPDLRGDELAARLCEREPGLAVILMSGYAEEDRAATPGRYPAPGFLQKPFDLETLGRALARALPGDPAATG